MTDIETLVYVTRQEALDKQASGIETDIHLGKSAKRAETLKGSWVVGLRSDTVLALCDEIERLRDERDALKDVLLRHGFVECDIAACNCGSWHARYGLRERMDEMRHILEDASHPLCNTNGNLIGNALKELVAERDALRAFAQDVMTSWPDGDVDGVYLQDIAEKYGLIKPEIRYAPCSEDIEECRCMNYIGTNDWKLGPTCYQITPLLTGEQQT